MSPRDRRPALEAALLAHLRAAPGAVPSRDLAARFLAIAAADEETCRRLLAPILSEVPGVAHRAGEGWRYEAGAGAAAGETGPPDVAPAGTIVAETEGLLDFVALAADGAGPGGAGVPRALTVLPVIAGEELQEEHLPSWGLDEDGAPVAPDGGDEVDQPGSARPASAGLTASDLEALAEIVGDLPIVAHRLGREVEPLRRAAEAAGIDFHPRIISAARLGHLLIGLKANHAAADLALALGVDSSGPDDCRGRARLVARAFLRLVPRLQEMEIRTVAALLEFQNLPAEPLDLSACSFTDADLKSLPETPGVYRFLDRDRVTIYIGKAKNLRARVGSYFVPSARQTEKGRAVLERTRHLEVESVASELLAILLEAALIAEHRPPLNRQFEVHERAAPYGPRLNLVLVMLDAGGATCTLHLTRGGRYLRRLPGVPVAGAAPAFGAIAAAIEAGYFHAAPPSGEAVDVDWPLVSSYLRRHRDTVNLLDIDECAGADEAVSRLRTLVAAAGAGARVLAR